MTAQCSDPSPELRASVEHFNSIPWCRILIANGEFKILDIGRAPTYENGHTLLGETLHTASTIAYLLVLYRPPSPSAISQHGEMVRLHTLGTGLNEHSNTLHGGAIATMLDSALGKLTRHELFSTYTVVLNLTYTRPVKTPCTVLIRSWITKTSGRKVWAQGHIEDCHGNIHATAEGLLLKPARGFL